MPSAVAGTPAFAPETALAPTEAIPVAPAVPGESNPARHLVTLLLFVTILGSPFVSIEPSPYEALVLILAVGLIATGLSLTTRLIPLMAIVYVWILGGLFAVMPVFNDNKATIYYFVSVYQALSVILFACLFSSDVMQRLAALRAAYITAASIAALIGTLAYFQLIPGSDTLMEMGRVRSTFKDPNVYGPFLILPLLLILSTFLREKIRIGYLVAWVVLLLGLFLSFSRGAWGHFIFSALLMVALLFATEKSAKRRGRLLGGVVVAGIAVTAIVGIALSTKVVSDMFTERASLVQDYDAEGRFPGQFAALEMVFDHPNGIGPRQFGERRGVDVHNVYLTGFLAYGWIGGAAYIALVLATLQIGFMALWHRTPWQPFLIAAFSTFVGVVAEGFIIDTDHWRHFFLLAGLIWGLSIASAKDRAVVENNQ